MTRLRAVPPVNPLPIRRPDRSSRPLNEISFEPISRCDRCASHRSNPRMPRPRGWLARLGGSRELRYATLAVPRASNRHDKSCARLTAGESARSRRRKRASEREIYRVTAMSRPRAGSGGPAAANAWRTPELTTSALLLPLSLSFSLAREREPSISNTGTRYR